MKIRYQCHKVSSDGVWRAEEEYRWHSEQYPTLGVASWFLGDEPIWWGDYENEA